MKTLLALTLLLAGCSKPHTSNVSEGHPLPVWVEAKKSGILNYGHWECPDGWVIHDELKWGSGPDVVTCQTEDEYRRRMEDYEKREVPQ